MIDPDTIYTLCAEPECPFFVEENSSHEDGDDLAPFVHLTRGDEADDAREDHDARPGMSAALKYWRARGPERVRERFID